MAATKADATPPPGGSGVAEPFVPAEGSTLRGIALLVGYFLLLLIVPGITSDIAGAFLPDDMDEVVADSYSAAFAEWTIGFVLLVIVFRLGWARWARVNTGIEWGALRQNWLIVVACLAPAFGMLLGDWPSGERIVAYAIDYLGTGFIEELGDRAMPLIFLTLIWRWRPEALRWAALAGGIAFGAVHFNPIILVLGPMFALAFVRLSLDMNSIWPSMLLHAAFDFFTEFPVDADGASESWPLYLAVAAIVVACVQAWFALACRSLDPDVDPRPSRTRSVPEPAA